MFVYDLILVTIKMFVEELAVGIGFCGCAAESVVALSVANRAADTSRRHCFVMTRQLSYWILLLF